MQVKLPVQGEECPPSSSYVPGLKFVDVLTPPETSVRLLDFVEESYVPPPSQQAMCVQLWCKVHMSCTGPPLPQSSFPLGWIPMHTELARTAIKPVFTNEPRAWLPFKEALFRYIQIIIARQPAPDELLLEYLLAFLPAELHVKFAFFQKISWLRPCDVSAVSQSFGHAFWVYAVIYCVCRLGRCSS